MTEQPKQQTTKVNVTIRLADEEAAKNLTPEQQQEFEAQCRQADPQRILSIIQQMLQLIDMMRYEN